MAIKRLWCNGNVYIKQLIFMSIFLLVGICSAAAQDIIVLRDGNMIDAKVLEISPTEIRYKRSDNLDGPTIVIPADRVLSIKYKNGTQEIINAAPAPAAEQKKTQEKPANTAMDPDKFIFAFNVNPGGFISHAYGPSLGLEFGKGHFNSEVNLIFSLGGGFGGLVTFNAFWPKRYGGFYLGGGLGYIHLPNYDSYSSSHREYISNGYGSGYYTTVYDETVYIDANILTIGLNIGWKFVTPVGIYFRTGSYIGIASYTGFYIKPDLAIGFCFK